MGDEIARRRRKLLAGSVVSRVGDKTVKVSCFYKIPHPVYGKEIKRKTVIYVHDADNACHVGDSVRVVETRPLSKLKRWRIGSIVSSVASEIS